MIEAPTWDLSDFYKGIDDPQIDADFKMLSLLIQKFKEKYHNKLNELSCDDFYQSLVEMNILSNHFLRLSTFANLSQSTFGLDTQVNAFYTKVHDKIQSLWQDLIFYDLEIAQISEEQMKRLMSDDRLEKYAYYIHELRKMRPHNLSEEIEQLLSQKSQTGSAAFVRLYGEQKAALKFNWQGETKNETQMMDLLHDKDVAVRKAAGEELVRVCVSQMLLFSRIYNTLLKDKQNSDEMFHFKSPIAARNLTNDVTDAEVNALVETVIQNAPTCVQPFYQLKARLLNLDKMTYWDRNVPIESKKQTTYSWDDAKEIVLTAYYNFDSRMGKIAQEFFDNRWIDASVYTGKRAGAFACAGPADIHPYLLVNFMGKARDVMTLAHEMGHGIHQYLARKQGLMKHSGLNMAETASIFGEMLVFNDLMKKTSDKEERIGLLSEKVNDMINTSFRQIAFHRFEEHIHRHRREEGELSPKDFQTYFVQTQKEILGDAVEMTEAQGSIFALVPHFINSPFYVYSYSFADCLVNSLYRVYEENKVTDFKDKYIELLSLGGSQSHYTLLKSFGLDTTKPDFWQKGIDVTKDLLKKLQTDCQSQSPIIF